MIDLRSDTVTKPTEAMLDAMHSATYGDDSRDGDATVQKLEALAAQSKRFNLDDSALSQAKEVIATVKKRLDVAQRMLENDMVFQGEDPAEVAVEQRNVLKEINELFASGGTATATVIALPAQR